MRFIFYTLSLIYSSIIDLRNLLFDIGVFKSKDHSIPVICIGNLSAGGSGKTPHTSYIAEVLKKQYRLAVLSRGYGRKCSGFNYVNIDSKAVDIGDEPLLIKRHNPECIVAVNNNRNKGVKKILKDNPDIDVILLDDGFQHRWIKAGLNIIITPYQKPYYKDEMLPIGTLRESIKAAKRANIIIVSKTPRNTNASDKQQITDKLDIKAYQRHYFSSISYQKFRNINNNTELENEEEYSITLVSGIAYINPLMEYLKEKRKKVTLIKFKDHHNYTSRDIENILLEHNKDRSTKKLILTTEKDAVKIRQFSTDLRGENIYYIPINIEISRKEMFEKQLDHYVTRN